MLIKLCNILLGEIGNYKKSVKPLPFKTVDQENIYLILAHLDILSYVYLGIRLRHTENGTILYFIFKDISRESTKGSFVIKEMVVKTRSLLMEAHVVYSKR
jgi:hypothetical protein